MTDLVQRACVLAGSNVKRLEAGGLSEPATLPPTRPSPVPQSKAVLLDPTPPSENTNSSSIRLLPAEALLCLDLITLWEQLFI